jgi:Lon protease-like protein
VAVSPSSAGKSELLPLFPLATVLVPQMRLSLHVFEPRYRQLVTDLLNAQGAGAPEFGVIALRQGREVGQLQDIYQVGTVARVTDLLPHPDGRCDLAAVGDRRFTVDSLDVASQPYLMASVRRLPEPDGDLRAGMVSALRLAIEAHLRALSELDVNFGEPPEDPPADPRSLSYAVARLAWLPLPDRQALLASPDTASRLRAARAVLRRETELVRQLRAVPINAATFRADPGVS